jgi:hypothetical protein
MTNLMNSGKPKEWGAAGMLEHLTPIEEARRFCHLAGWHDHGDTRVMFRHGGFMEMPEALAEYSAHMIAERDAWRKIAEDLQNVTIAPPIIVSGEKLTPKE